MKTVFAKGLEGQMNVTVGFRKILQPSENLTLRLAASNVFRVCVNGRLVGYGPKRCAHGYSNIETVSLSGYKKSFCLTVEIAAYCCGSYYTVDEKPFFACEVKDGLRLVCEADSFEAFHLNDRIQRVQRYSFQRTFTESYIMDSARAKFYNAKATAFPRLDVTSLDSNKLLETDLPPTVFKKQKISKVIEHGGLFVQKNPNLWASRTLDVHDKFRGFPKDGLESYLSKEVSAIGFDVSKDLYSPALNDGYVLYDTGRNYSSFIGAKLKAEEDSEIYFVFDEIIWDEAKENEAVKNWFTGTELPLSFFRLECCNIIKYKLKKGHTYNLLSFEPYTFRYIKLIVKGSVFLNDFYHIPYENSAAGRISFTSDDGRLNNIFDAAVATFAQNAVDVLTDCPSRERAGWLCDSYFSGRAEQLITGSNKVEYNFLNSYLLAPQLPELPDSMLPMCYPADHFNGRYIPNWSMFFIIELEDYLKRTNDRAFVDKCKDKVMNLINFFESNYVNADGLLEKLDSWIFVEWSKTAHFVQDINFPSNMLYYAALRSAINMYGVSELEDRALQIKKAIIKHSYNGEFFEDNLVYENGIAVRKGNTTETCQYYAFYFGIAEKESFPALYEKMFTVFGQKRDDKNVYPQVFRSNAFIGNFLRLDYLKGEGRLKQVYDEIFEYFSYMAQRTCTLWENDSPHASCNHGFASYVAAFILEAVAGYKGFNPATKKVFLTTPAVICDFSAKLPIDDGYLVLTGKNGKIKLKLPNGYSIA